MEKLETVADFIFECSRITADGDCSHEIKRHLVLGRKVMSNLDSIFKIRDITLPTKVGLVKAMVLHSPTLTSIHDHRKTIALSRRTLVGKVMSLLLNMLSRLVITFLPRSKRLLISWLQSPSAVILEPQNIKSDTVYTVSPSISHEVMGLDAMIFVF